ncbi:unnamed protein product [Bursaphelenchus xylophilus]|uniref:(pine wood nematode) hypothetical protein n=1 Tax=Bursaphelenchus xylophilus TaxID=6326 RepID=A0A1I7SX74_BURXY|nr:unnamed protein product [Bursaphelenchus xylophilus]CAG9100230.1 unnamed protein product [Bursaphelenchus xylophilus]
MADLRSVGYKLLQRLPNEISHAIFLRLSPFEVEDCPEEWSTLAESIYRDACIENRFPLHGQTFRDSFFLYLRQISDSKFRPPQPSYNATYALQSFLKYARLSLAQVEVTVISRQFAYQEKALPFGLDVLDRIERSEEEGKIKLVIGNSYQADLVARNAEGFSLRKENRVTIPMKYGPNGLLAHFFGSTLYYIEHDGCHRLYSVNLLAECDPICLSTLPIPEDKTLLKLSIYPPHLCLLYGAPHELYYCNMETNDCFHTPNSPKFLNQKSVADMQIVNGLPYMKNPIFLFSFDEIVGHPLYVQLPLTEDSRCFVEDSLEEHSRVRVERIDEKYKCLVIDKEHLLLPFATKPFLPHFFFVILPTFKSGLCYQRRSGDRILFLGSG